MHFWALEARWRCRNAVQYRNEVRVIKCALLGVGGPLEAIWRCVGLLSCDRFLLVSGAYSISIFI